MRGCVLWPKQYFSLEHPVTLGYKATAVTHVEPDYCIDKKQQKCLLILLLLLLLLYSR